jgi:hypothetical protein
MMMTLFLVGKARLLCGLKKTLVSNE